MVEVPKKVFRSPRICDYDASAVVLVGAPALDEEHCMKHGILMHEPNDDVGVAVEDLAAGADIGAITLEGTPVATVRLVDAVPLGHKVAMRDIPKGTDVTEYGRVIGMATKAAPKGGHVHTHCLATKRWTS
jgi:(2R)-sulfolactate sulfo-lyase subunit alpha